MKKSLIIIGLGIIVAHVLSANAGVVPGTISKGSGSSSLTCPSSSSYYSPTGTSCSCSLYNYSTGPVCGCSAYNSGSSSVCGCAAYNSSSSSICGCKTYSGGKCTVRNTCVNPSFGCKTRNTCVNPSFGCKTWNGCRDSSFGCQTYSISGNGGTSYTNYSSNNSVYYFSQTTYSTKLANDSNEYCFMSVIGTTHTPPGKATGSCPGGVTMQYYTATGKNGTCSASTAIDNYISSYNQLGSITRNKPSSIKSTCTIEGRYATSDVSTPTVTVNGVKSVFTSDLNKWCNIVKYPTGVKTEGCEYYRGLNTTGSPTAGQDLLKGLEITIGTDPSGIGEVQVIIGKCGPYTYAPNTTTLSNILNSTTASIGVKTDYTKEFTIKYSGTFSALGKPNQLSLLSAFGVSRLDQCLEEGKNSLLVLTKDMAVSETDGKTPAPNISTITRLGTINIDNSDPLIKVDGTLSTTDVWRNYSVIGNIKQGEKYNGPKNSCPDAKTGTGTCGTPPSGLYWVRPVGVNPTTGVYNRFFCNGVRYPTDADCEAGCPPPGVLVAGTCKGLTIDGKCGTSNGQAFTTAPTNNLCAQGTLASFAGTGPWTWKCTGIGGTTASCSTQSGCITYAANPCIGGFKDYCLDAGYIASEIDIDCVDTSTAGGWYKANGRCGDKKGLTYRNGKISTLGTTAAYSAFKSEFLANCVNYIKTTNLTTCNEIGLCGNNGRYVPNTASCRDKATCTPPTIENKCGPGKDEITLSNGQIWSCKNIGSSAVWDGVNEPTKSSGSPTNVNASLSRIGTYYQWGKNTSTWSVGGGNTDNNAWGGVGTTVSNGDGSSIGASNLSLMQGPCQSGRHIPTALEWKKACDTIAGGNCESDDKTSITKLQDILKMPLSGFRTYDQGYYSQGAGGYYLSSTPFGSLYYMVYFRKESIGSPGVEDYFINPSLNVYGRDYGFSIRCLKNTTVATIDGVCGSQNGTTTATKPSTNLCTVGTASTVSGLGPWTWTCASAGGTTASCNANLKTTSTCADGNNTPASSQTVHNADIYNGNNIIVSDAECKKNFVDAKAYCNNLVRGGYSDWILPAMTGIYTNCSEKYCVAPGEWQATTSNCPSQPGELQYLYCKDKTIGLGYNTSNTSYYSSTDPVPGMPRALILFFGGDGWYMGTNTEQSYTARCIRKGVANSGMCGAVNGTTTASEPKVDLCTAGTPTAVIESGNKWTRTCKGSGGDATCSTNMGSTTVDGDCGTIDGTFVGLTKPTTNLCKSGTPTGVTEDTQKWLWTCNGTNGGVPASCSAKKYDSCDPESCPAGYTDLGVSTTTKNLLNTNTRKCSPNGPYNNILVGIVTIQGDLCASVNNRAEKGYWSQYFKKRDYQGNAKSIIKPYINTPFANGCIYNNGLQPNCEGGSTPILLASIPSISKYNWGCYMDKQSSQSVVGTTTSKSLDSTNVCDDPADSTYIYCDLMSNHGYVATGRGPFCHNDSYKYMVWQGIKSDGRIHYTQSCIKNQPAEYELQFSCNRN